MAVFRIVPNPTNPTQNIVVDPLGNLAVIRADNGTSVTISPTDDVVNKLNVEYAKNLATTNNVQSSLEQAINVLKMSNGNTGASNDLSGSRITTGQNTNTAATLTGPANNADFSVDDYTALTNRMNLMVQAANLYAKLYGFLVTPRVDPVTGNITGYDPVLDNNQKQIPTQEAIRQGFDIDKLITDNEVARAGLAGKIKDPSDPTKWINTPASLLQLAQTNLAAANADKIAVDSEIARAGISGKMKDPTDPTGKTWIDTPEAKLKAAQTAATIAGTSKLDIDSELARAGITGRIKDPTDPTGTKWIDTPAALLLAAQAKSQAAQTTASEANAEQIRNDIRVKNQELLSAALADPNKFVEAYTKANLYGTRLAGATPTPPANLGANGVALDTSALDAALGNIPSGMNPGVSSDMAVTQGNIDALGSTTQLPISANLNAALGGRYVGNAASVSDNGTAGYQSLSNVTPVSGNYAKINPVVYNNLDPNSQAQYNSLALAKQGIDKDTLKKTISSQLGGESGGVPAAFRLR